MRILVRPAFYQDITREELWLLEHAGAEIADDWHEKLWTAIQFLEANPEIGRLRFDLDANGIRSWRVKGFERWLVFYGRREDVLILFRVVSGTMNLPLLRFD